MIDGANGTSATEKILKISREFSRQKLRQDQNIAVKLKADFNTPVKKQQL